MTNEHTPDSPTDSAFELAEDHMEEDYETAAEHHRMAAHHFSAAAKHHLSAALAEDEGEVQASARHAYLAYGHQLNGVQYAEIAAMDNESLDDDHDDVADADKR